MRSALPALLLVFGFAAAAHTSACKKKPMSEAERRMKAPPPAMEDMEKYIAKLRKRGYLRKIEPEKNIAYVQNDLWVLSSYNLRRIDTYALAHYCGLKSGTQDFRVEVRIFGTEDAVATWDRKFGYKPVR